MKITLINGEFHYYGKEKDYDDYNISDGLMHIYKCTNDLGTHTIAIFPLRNVLSIIF